MTKATDDDVGRREQGHQGRREYDRKRLPFSCHTEVVVCACGPPWEAGRVVARKGGGLRFKTQVLRFKNTYIDVSEGLHGCYSIVNTETGIVRVFH